jgi:phosphate transport system substrate-binding protein
MPAMKNFQTESRLRSRASPLFRVAAVSLLAAVPSLAQTVQVDPRLPEYKTVQGVAGNIKSAGSETMNNLMTLWLEGFKGFYPNVTNEIEGKGSASAPPALIKGAATFGPMSRPMKDTEIAEFETKYGHKPVGLETSIDMLAVYVNKDNPLKSLTLQQVDAIFSKTRKGGAEKDLATWGELGLTGEWADKPISLYGRNSASGTRGYFAEHALFKGDYKDTVKEQQGSSGVVQAVSSDRYAIGYSGIGSKTADVRALPLAKNAQSPTIEATLENAYSGSYPLSRFLYLYLNCEPGKELDPLRREFLLYVFSKQGQAVVVKDGYYPVTAETAKKALAKVSLTFKTVEAGAAH